MKFSKIMSAGFFLSGWLNRASKDGKITLDEIVEVIEFLSENFDVKLEFDLKSIQEFANYE